MIYQTIHQLVNKALILRLIEEEDVYYARNQVLSLLQLEVYEEELYSCANDKSMPELLEEIIEYACNQGIIENFLDAKEILSSHIMNCFTARPSEINRVFYMKYKNNPEDATDYFYQLSQNSNYIQMKRIAKNIEYKVQTKYGQIDITINLSKPEKDPKQIEKEKNTKSSNYPKCLLCIENEGYPGRIGHPARSNHRVIRIPLGGERWNLQYSPYVYYPEHCILFSQTHRKMSISKETFSRLLAFVDCFPHYFIGSNADLPIVGGSILSHDHYQGGCYEFPMAKAVGEYSFHIQKYNHVVGEIIYWPMAVIRLRSDDMYQLVETAGNILEKWKSYSDESVDIHAFTGLTPHNTITPIARKRSDFYELDLVLRNNRTNEEHPFGIFHPHEDVHHIKKENIGLIEVMGLAVLPARLKGELIDVEKFLLNVPNDIAAYHLPWALEMKEKYAGKVTPSNIKEIVKAEVGIKFQRVLEDASVFKRNEKGKSAFRRFVDSLNEENQK
ncbi:UDP-glucose--hexose-1-phosphate uridylyltransferase [Heyndrickxia sporothermodurans]